MPRGVYERKKKKLVFEDAPRRGRQPKANGYGELLDKLRAERDKAIDRVTALGTAIEALEALA